MNRVVLLDIDGIDQIAESDKIDLYPALMQLTKHVAYGNLSSDVILPWDLAIAHALSGIKTPAPVQDNQLPAILPKKGIAIKHIKFDSFQFQ